MSVAKYSIKCPEHIVIGDPWYFETETGERLKKLVVDYRPEERFSARLNIEELEEGGMNVTNVYICFAPEKDIELYMADYRYETQKLDRKTIYVDTSKYKVSVDGRTQNFYTALEGTWGAETTIYHEDQKGRKNVDAVMISLFMPYDMSFELTKQQMSVLFEEMELLPERRSRTSEIRQPEKKTPKR